MKKLVYLGILILLCNIGYSQIEREPVQESNVVVIDQENDVVTFNLPNIPNATFTLSDLISLQNEESKIIPVSEFNVDQETNELFIGYGINGSLNIQELASVVNGTSDIVDIDFVEKFEQMQTTIQDQTAILENWTSRQDRIARTYEQLGTYINAQLNDNLNILQWSKESIKREPANPSTPEPTPAEGRMVYEDDTLYVIRNGQKVEISNSRIQLNTNRQ